MKTPSGSNAWTIPLTSRDSNRRSASTRTVAANSDIAVTLLGLAGGYRCDGDRNPVEHGVSGQLVEDGLVGERVGVDPGVRGRDGLRAGRVAPAVRQADHTRHDPVVRLDRNDQLAGGGADDGLAAQTKAGHVGRVDVQRAGVA